MVIAVLDVAAEVAVVVDGGCCCSSMFLVFLVLSCSFGLFGCLQ